MEEFGSSVILVLRFTHFFVVVFHFFYDFSILPKLLEDLENSTYDVLLAHR